MHWQLGRISLLVGLLGALSGCAADPDETKETPLAWAWGNNELLIGQLESPGALAVQPSSGNLYILDQKTWKEAQVHVFSPEGDFIRRWDIPHPVYLIGEATFAPDGSLFLTDAAWGKVIHLGSDGTYKKSWGEWNLGPHYFTQPTGIAVGKDGRVYVSEPINNRIKVFDAEGVPIRTMGGGTTGLFYEPKALALDSEDFLYVADVGQCRIQKFDAAGQWVRTWGQRGPDQGELNENWTLALDGDDEVVTMEQQLRVQRFASNGTFRVSWPGVGDLPGYYGPRVAIDGERGIVYTIGLRGFGVQAYDREGHLLWEVAELPASRPGQLHVPTLIATTGDEALIKGTHFVTHFKRGVYQTQWKVPSDFFIVDMTATPDAMLLLSNHFGQIRKVSLAGNLTASFRLVGGPADIGGMDVDETGRIWVTDPGGERVMAFSGTGAFLRAWGKTGTAPGELTEPRSIAVRKGWVVVCDDDALKLFAENGTFVRNLATWKSADDAYTRVTFSGDQLFASAPAGDVGVFNMRSDQFGLLAGTWVRALTWPGTLGDVAASPDGSMYVLVPDAGQVLTERQALRFKNPTTPGF